MAIQTFTAAQVLTAAQMNSLQANDYNQTVSAKVASYTLVAADKGTRITMSNAAATTITVNTSLFAAGDSLRIQNIGAGACTITAGTATVTSAGSLSIPQWGGGQLFFTSASAAIWFPDAYSNPTSATVATSQTTTSTSFTDLATVGPAVTVTTGTSALVIITAQIVSSNGNDAVASFAVSGATTTSPTNSISLSTGSAGGLISVQASAIYYVTLTAGSNTFTMKYKMNAAGTLTAIYRTITVIPL